MCAGRGIFLLLGMLCLFVFVLLLGRKVHSELGLVRSEIPLLKVPTRGLWSVVTVKSGSPLR